MKSHTHASNDEEANNSHGEKAVPGDITFAAGYVTRYLEDYARSREIPTFTLAIGVATLIRASANGEVLWSEDSLPQVRRSATQRGKTPREMALAGSPRGVKTQVKHPRKGSHIAPWTDSDDGTIIALVRQREQIGAPEVARELTKRLKGRTTGAIRQRISRLVKIGSLKASKSKAADGGMPFLLVRAA